jgi:hypothetical protein
MILVDTDHATFLSYPDSERGARFIERLTAVSPQELIGVAIVSVEERMRGWLAKTAIKSVGQAVPAQPDLRNFELRGAAVGCRILVRTRWLSPRTVLHE